MCLNTTPAMKRNNLLEKTLLLVCTIVAGALLGGCAGPMSKTSKYMNTSFAPPASPPPGKVLVCIQRPKALLESKVYTAIWDGTNLIADLGNGHSVAYVCEPGQHYFMNLSADSPACVEAQLLPDKTYDLWIANIPIRLKPVHKNDMMQQQIADWTSKNHWVTPASSAAGYEQKKQEKIQQLLGEFTSGKRHDQLQQMAAEDHR
jgi:hypothetical protein